MHLCSYLPFFTSVNSLAVPKDGYCVNIHLSLPISPTAILAPSFSPERTPALNAAFVRAQLISSSSADYSSDRPSENSCNSAVDFR